MRRRVIERISLLSSRLLGIEISPGLHQFIAHTSWSFVGVIVNAGAFFVLNILAGRLLGPSGYGNYNLVVAVAAVLIIVMSAGFDNTAIKYISETVDLDRRKRIASNTIQAVAGISIILMLVMLLFRGEVSKLLHTSEQLVLLAIMYAFVFTHKAFLDGLLKANKLFRKQALVKIVEAIFALILFVTLLKLHILTNYAWYVLVLCAAAVVAIITILPNFLSSITRWDREVHSQIRGYLRTFQSFAAIGVILSSIDKFFIARYLGPSDLGMYSAYLMSATVFVAQLVLILNNVFFPTVNEFEDKKQIFYLLNRLFVISAIPILLLTAALSYVVVRLLGSEYPIHYVYFGIVACIAFFQIYSSLYNSLAASSKELFAVTTRIIYLKPVVILILYGLLVYFNLVTITSVLLMMVITYMFDVCAVVATFYRRYGSLR